jgi:nucleotide-binding universal stress UspA family protein
MSDDFMKTAREAIEAQLRQLAQEIPNAHGVLIHGHSARSILDYVDENKTDLIVVASHRPGMQDLLLGSTATHLVRHAPCAVHVMR